MPLEAFGPPSPSVKLHSEEKPTSPTREFAQLYTQMVSEIYRVFPPRSDAWKWRSEFGEVRDVTHPPVTAAEWLRQRYIGSDSFSQGLARRGFTRRRDLEAQGFRSNDLRERPHQIALHNYLVIIGMCSGTREACSTLLRAHFAAGKSLIGGDVVIDHCDLIKEMLHRDHVPRNELPRGAIVGINTDVLIQNVLGKQYTVLKPPYVVNREAMRDYHTLLSVQYGMPFDRAFPRPSSKSDPWFLMFAVSEEHEVIDGPARINAYLEARGTREAWKQIPRKKREEIVGVVAQLIEGGAIALLPDAEGVPQVRDAAPRRSELLGKKHRYQGDFAHGLDPELPVKTSSRALACDPSHYTATLNTEAPGLFCIAGGNTLLRNDPASIRADLGEEIMPYLKALYVDDIQKQTPQSLGNAARKASGRFPNIIGFTGRDEGVLGWQERTPELRVEKGIEIGITQPIGFMRIGDLSHPPSPGTEEAWQVFEDWLFSPKKLCKALDIPEPFERDAFLIAPSGWKVLEYGHRLMEAYQRAHREAEVYCYHRKILGMGKDGYRVLSERFNFGRPRAEGEPPRIFVGPIHKLARGLSVPIQCIYVLDDLRNDHERRQLCGRLHHQENLVGSERERDTKRTLFCEQDFYRGRDLLIRALAEEQGFPLESEGALWVEGMCAIDRLAKERDARRRVSLGRPLPIPDIWEVRKRTQPTVMRVGRELRPTGRLAREEYERLEERKRRRARKQKASPAKVSVTPPKSPPSPPIPSSVSPSPPSAPTYLLTDERVVIFRRPTPPVERVPPPAPVKSYVARRSVQNEHQRKPHVLEVVLPVMIDGMPRRGDVDALANEHGIPSLASPLFLAIQDAHQGGKRGRSLAASALQKILNLQAKQAGWAHRVGTLSESVERRARVSRRSDE